MERIKWLKKDNKGELMLESLIVYPITLFLLFFILELSAYCNAQLSVLHGGGKPPPYKNIVR